MNTMKKVAVLGSSGNMGSTSGAIFAGAEIECLFFARNMEKAEKGIENAMSAVRSGVVRSKITPKTYEELETEIPGCDWVLEALAEDIAIKKDFFGRIDKVRRPGTIVSSVSSGLSIQEMVEDTSPDFKAHSLGTHFYNPPSKLLANELIYHPDNSPEFRSSIAEFCKKRLGRVNIVTYDTPGFAGNRIGFEFLNSAAIAAEKLGAARVEYLLGPYTGRAMPPLATIDLVGFDVHKAIVSNLRDNTSDMVNDSFRIPDYVLKMIDKGMMGNKTADTGGFYLHGGDGQTLIINPQTLAHEEIGIEQVDFIEEVKELIHNGLYRKAVARLFSATGDEADLVQKFILRYIAYSFSLIGIATPEEDGIHGIDRVMAYGFSWLPPSGWVDFIGGAKPAIELIEKTGIEVPERLASQPDGKICRMSEISRYLIGG